MASDKSVVLYYNEVSSPSRKVLIGLYEKKVDFQLWPIDLVQEEQLQEWYLKINPRGEVPVLKHGDTIVPESSNILEYIDKTFGRPGLLYPPETSNNIRSFVAKVDANVPVFVLTYGVTLFQAESLTRCLRYPYSTLNREEVKRRFLQRPGLLRQIAERGRESEIGPIFLEKARNLEKSLSIMTDGKKFLHFLRDVEAVLDVAERELSREDRSGQWLYGSTFSAADITLTSLLMRLYQLGLEDKFWKEGRRPHLSVYQELAFRRPSVEKATNWRKYENNVTAISPNAQGDQPAVDAAYVGLAAVLVLGGIYAVKKLFFRR